MNNEIFGWLWISLGLASGAVLGLFFHRADWLGGYDSYRRRLVRLGHISFFGLGILNVLYSLTAYRLSDKGLDLRLTSWSMIVGGIAMPLCCGLTAWRAALKPIFIVPVASLLIGAVGLTLALLGL